MCSVLTKYNFVVIGSFGRNKNKFLFLPHCRLYVASLLNFWHMCIFCDIFQKKTDTEIIYEDDNFVAFNDILPKAPIHILIVPKRHIGSVKDTDETSETLLGKMIIAAKTIAERHSLNGYKLIFNVGKEGGQIVDHLHLHLLGGWNTKIKKVEI